LNHPWISPFLFLCFADKCAFASRSTEALYAPISKYQIGVLALVPVCATEIALALDKRPQSKESGRSGYTRRFRFPVEDK
jgi:hypothetical protein